jgi:hypothetical protein
MAKIARSPQPGLILLCLVNTGEIEMKLRNPFEIHFAGLLSDLRPAIISIRSSCRREKFYLLNGLLKLLICN